MSKNGKQDKYGHYVRKVGYMDIRQKIVPPIKFKNRITGKHELKPGSVEVRLYHGKKRIEGDFKNHEAAEAMAKKLQNI